MEKKLAIENVSFSKVIFDVFSIIEFDAYERDLCFEAKNIVDMTKMFE